MPRGNGLGNRYDLGTGFVPVDMSAAANTGKRLAMEGLASVDVVFIKAAGTAGDDPTLTLQSHTASSGGTSANLAVISEYYVKNATTIANTETWTTVAQTAAATIADPGGGGTSAEEQQITVFTVLPGDLPSGHKYISASVADVGANAQIGTVLYIMHPYDGEATPADYPAPLR